MLQKVLITFVITTICVFHLSGCKKRSGESEQPVVKTKAEYKAEAEKQITKENMTQEIGKIEKEMEQDIAQEQQTGYSCC